MIIGLTGGIASGKTKFENIFKASGYSIFDVDVIDSFLRTGVIDIREKSNLFYSNSLINFANRLSKDIFTKLKKKFPEIYDKNNNFLREFFLKILNDRKNGKKNSEIYNEIIGPASRKFYLEWIKNCKKNIVISSAVLIERGNLDLVEKLYIVNIPRSKQLANLINREVKNGKKISRADANKAIDRQLPFKSKLSIAKLKLGEKNIVVLDKKYHLKNKEFFYIN